MAFYGYTVLFVHYQAPQKPQLHRFERVTRKPSFTPRPCGKSLLRPSPRSMKEIQWSGGGRVSYSDTHCAFRGRSVPSGSCDLWWHHQGRLGSLICAYASMICLCMCVHCCVCVCVHVFVRANGFMRVLWCLWSVWSCCTVGHTTVFRAFYNPISLSPVPGKYIIYIYIRRNTIISKHREELNTVRRHDYTNVVCGCVFGCLCRYVIYSRLRTDLLPNFLLLWYSLVHPSPIKTLDGSQVPELSETGLTSSRLSYPACPAST